MIAPIAPAPINGEGFAVDAADDVGVDTDLDIAGAGTMNWPEVRGKFPTVMVAVTVFVAASITVTVLFSQFVA
jgi:hypothetical protein